MTTRMCLICKYRYDCEDTSEETVVCGDFKQAGSPHTRVRRNGNYVKIQACTPEGEWYTAITYSFRTHRWWGDTDFFGYLQAAIENAPQSSNVYPCSTNDPSSLNLE